MEELSRLVIETASQRLGSAAQKDFRTQELAIEKQTRLVQSSRFQTIGSPQKEIAKKFYKPRRQQ